MIKEGVRILALEGAPFRKGDEEALVIGTIGRRGAVEGILSFMVRVDGEDSTAKIIRAVARSRFADQIRLVALNGITLAGLNLVDVKRVERELRVKVIAITRKKPHLNLLINVVNKWARSRNKSRIMKYLEKDAKISRTRGYYVQYLNTAEGLREGVILRCADLLRLSHIIASGLARGESRGRM
ncbi:MAG: DUF99 family protein [Candidatus Marsarchaeota archaeon]|jgi:hypothetical protein|nr:DUF99 family protein [Candidatus Marsarchaeota archaeon]